MLKIREYDDNGNKIDLKVLEKFGLKPKYDENTGEIKGYSTNGKIDGRYERCFRISKKKKRLLFRKSHEMYIIDEDCFNTHYCCYDESCDFDLLYDLTKAGLVEKVGDDNVH